jgi:hypothetical protein
VKFAVETWAPEYGASIDDSNLGVTTLPVDPNVEVPADRWRPLLPAPVERPERILFVDGVRRVDARIWINDGAGGVTPGLCATVAAGAVCAEPGRASLMAAEVRRGVYSAAPDLAGIATRFGAYEPCRVANGTPEGLILGVHERMTALEKQLARALGEGMIIVDGPLRGPDYTPGAIGYIKSQHVRYLPDALQAVVGTLAEGERAPLFCIGGPFTKLSWYLRLPGPIAHPLSGIVRCEMTADHGVAAATPLADLVTATLPVFASEPHKDTRAPQNLHPIAGLERELRRRLGDATLAERALRVSAATADPRSLRCIGWEGNLDEMRSSRAHLMGSDREDGRDA